MRVEESEMDDPEFTATFSLLPHVLKISAALANAPTDPQIVQSAISELQAQLQRCHKVLEACPFLDHTPSEQKALLDKKRRELQRTCDLLLLYKSAPLLSSSPSTLNR